MRLKLFIKISFLLVIIFFLCLISHKAYNKKYPEFSVKFNTELGCIELFYEGITYRPYGIFTSFNKLTAKQIGVNDNSPNSKIYELKGYDSREWIVEYLDVLMGTNRLLKSIDVIEIPKELEKYKVDDF